MSIIIKSDQIATKSLGNIFGVNAPLDFNLMLDFTRGQYVKRIDGKPQSIQLSDAISFARASEAEYKDKSGIVKIAEINVPRIHTSQTLNATGLLIERESTNLLANPKTPVTQTITIPTHSINRAIVLSVEGSGSATMSGDASSLGSVSATQGNPQAGVLTSGSSKVVTVTVTGTLTRFQLEVATSGQGGACATSFLPDGVSQRKADIVKLAKALETNINSDTTIVLNFVVTKRLLTTASTLDSVLNVLHLYEAGTSGGGLSTQLTLPNPLSGNALIRTNLPAPMAGGSFSSRFLLTSSFEKHTIAVTYTTGLQGVIHSANGMSNAVSSENTAVSQILENLTLGLNGTVCGLLTHLAIYPRYMSTAEIEKLTTSWL